MAKPLPDDLADAPLPVQEAARFAAQHSGTQRRISIGVAVTMFSGLLATGLLHDIAGWSELASGMPLLVALVAVVAVMAWTMRGPLRELPAQQAMVQRYRALNELGLTATPDPTEAATAVDRLCDRIAALAGDRSAVVDAAAVARQRVATLQAEQAHLTAMMAGDPALVDSLAGVAERVEAEVSRIRAHLAETYAALIEADTGGAVAADALEEATARLTADGEVERAARIVETRARAGTQ